MIRRQFLKFGILAPFVGLVPSCSLIGGQKIFTFSDSQRKDLLSLMSVLVGDPDFSLHSANQGLNDLEKTLNSLPPYLSSEVVQLFNLINFPISRFLFFGYFSSFDRLSPTEIDHSLNRMKGSGFILMRTAYQGLRELLLSFYYSTERSWEAIGYPGPPEV